MNVVKTLILTMVVALLSCALPVYGANEKEDNGEYSLIIYDLCGENETPVPGATFKVVKVADLSPKGVYELRDEYKFSGVTNDDINSMKLAADVNEVMRKLMGINSLGAEDSYEVMTDASGKIEIKGLTAGLYLVTAVSLETENTVYESSPSLIAVPDYSGETVQTNVTVYAKTSVSYSQETGTESQSDETSEEETSEESTDGTTEEETGTDETESATEETSTEETESGTEETSEEQTESGAEETSEENIESGAEETEPDTTKNSEEETGTSAEETSASTEEESVTEADSGIGQVISSILTGDNAPLLALAIIAIIALIVIIIEIYLMIKKRGSE